MNRNKEKVLVSVIIPTYNHENYIGECLTSVCRQEVEAIEIIVIDDASTDRTLSIVENLAKEDKRIRIIKHDTNWGMYRLSETCNQGLEIAKGEYIAVLEGDDFWPKSKLRIQLPPLIANKEAVLSHGLMALVNQKGESWVPSYQWPPDIRENRPIGSALKALLLGDNHVSTQTAIIRRCYLERINGFQPKSYPLFVFDYPTWMELALLGPFLFMPQVLGFWRRYPKSVSAFYHEKLWKDHIQYTKLFIETHRDRLKQLKIDLTDYLKHYSCYALLDLTKMEVINQQWSEARINFQRSLKNLKLVLRKKINILKFFILTISLFFKRDFFSPLFKFYNRYKWFRGFS